METIIHYNGSKWAGQAPDDLQVLLDRMRDYSLSWPGTDPFMTWETFEQGPIMPADLICTDLGVITEDGATLVGKIIFSGNFYKISHAFRISTDDPEVIATLRHAIAENYRVFIEAKGAA